MAKAGAAPGTTAGVELLLHRFPRSNPSRSHQAAPRPYRVSIKTLTWHASSCSQQPPRGHTSMASSGHPEATPEWLLIGRFNNPLACFILQPTGTPRTWHASSCSQQLPRGHTSMASYGHPEATSEWLLMGRLNNPLACFILQPTGTPRPHINSFLWASKPAVCQPLALNP